MLLRKQYSVIYSFYFLEAFITAIECNTESINYGISSLRIFFVNLWSCLPEIDLHIWAADILLFDFRTKLSKLPVPGSLPTRRFGTRFRFRVIWKFCNCSSFDRSCCVGRGSVSITSWDISSPSTRSGGGTLFSNTHTIQYENDDQAD